MTLDEIRQKAAPILERYGAQYAGVFGSVARGDNTPHSDVDVLVVLKQSVSLLKFFALNDELETALGCELDLVTRNSLNRHLKPFALQELQTVYEEVRWKSLSLCDLGELFEFSTFPQPQQRG